MESLEKIDQIGAQLLEKLPELMEAGTLYGNDLFNRFITYKTIVSSLDVFVGVIFLFIASWIVRKVIKNHKELDGDLYPVVFFGTAFFVIVGGLLFIGGALDVVQLQIVPEVYIMEYFTKT